MIYEEIGCPADYNPGFCSGDEHCIDCWREWIKNNQWLVREAQKIADAIAYVSFRSQNNG